MRPLLILALAGTALANAGCGDPDPETGLDGDWALTWTCMDRCDLPAPPTAQSTTLRIDDTRLHWSYANWLVHEGGRTGECLDVPAGVDWAVRSRDAYELCLTAGDTIETEVVEIGQAGAAQTHWSMVGARM